MDVHHCPPLSTKKEQERRFSCSKETENPQHLALQRVLRIYGIVMRVLSNALLYQHFASVLDVEALLCLLNSAAVKVEEN